ncbi:ABC transporter permease [Sanguibacter suaedae]|uniref:FtsX-like permease family protein n=1 Tax=Sanguibacter suaedae TaxID=2795737 RepID=A0A934IBB9_9MICO|nr:FtsX-like permease family protein [Sanguibacter suaedae]MBI9114741.1 FtsX-like permease family protein [Sanguibacter suaedae]
MIRITLAQMRRSVGRLTAAGIAIVIGTAFVAATLLAGDVLKRASYDSVAAAYADATLAVVVTDPYSAPESLTAEEVDALGDVDGVQAVAGRQNAYLTLGSGTSQVFQPAIGVGPDPALQPLTVTEGRFPGSAVEVALPASTLELLNASVGGTVEQQVETFVPDPDDEDGGEWVSSTQDLTVTGVVDDPYGAFATQGGAAVLTDEALEETLEHNNDSEKIFSTVLVLAEPGADVAQVRAAVEAEVADGYEVLTKDEAAASAISSLTSGANVLTSVILGFAAISLLVAALVISNTFQVLVAQRTRVLALLRCVGATKAQLRASVALEALILGIVSSVAGFVLGAGLVQVALVVVGRMDVGIPVPGTIAVTVASLLWPVLIGTAVTVVASLVPARAATRVAPLAALRPADAPALTGRAGKLRGAASLLLVVGGTVALVGALLLSRRGGGNVEIALVIGIAGGAVSFVGILLGAVFWLPGVVSRIGAVLARSGVSARLAAANTGRNPRRTAATSTALLIGVTLVAMMSVGAATARTSLTGTLDDTYPVDVSIGSQTWDETEERNAALPAATLAEVDELDGVAHVTRLESTDADLVVGESETTATVRGVSAADAADAVRASELFSELDDDTILLPWNVGYGEITDGATVTVTGPDGERELTVREVDVPGYAALVTPATLAALDTSTVVDHAWVRLVDLDATTDTVTDIRGVFSDTAVEISGAAVERATMQEIIDTFLAVIVGLLAIAVIIALIGVANTLALSVIERRRESATLRAIGLSRRQLRATLAVEGMLIAGVGALLGVLLGLVYGWLGSVIALGTFADVTLTVPWRDLTLVLVVALAAGLAASVLPARTAARTSPVEALAVE